jgi:hypothetical protein
VTTPLPLERFAELLAAYGARPELWPSAERSAALTLRDSSPEARALFDTEAGLDASFAALPEPELAPDFLRRLNEVPVRAAQSRRRFSFRAAWIPALSWAFAAVLGLGLGFTTEPLDTDEADTTMAVAAIDSATANDSDVNSAADDDLSALTLDVLDELEE